MTNSRDYEVIIVGGSYAGLSAAMALGRSLRKVVIIDSGMPCNRQTPHSHNFVTHDGAKPSAISETAREQVLNYSTIELLNDLAVSGTKTENGFRITTEKGKDLRSKKLIFATGIKDIMPETKGFASCWGITVIHCPYCHGYEFRNKKTGIIANGERAFHLASLVNNLTDNITLLTSGKAKFPEEQLQKLNHHKIQIIETELSEIQHQNGQITDILLKDGNKINFDAVYAAIPFVQHCDIPGQLGCEFTESGHIKVDGFQQTTVKGLFACGDNSSVIRSLANAVGTGNQVGAIVNRTLTEEQF